MCINCNWTEFVEEADALIEDVEQVTGEFESKAERAADRLRDLVAWAEDHEHVSAKMWNLLRSFGSQYETWQESSK